METDFFKIVPNVLLYLHLGSVCKNFQTSDFFKYKTSNIESYLFISFIILYLIKKKKLFLLFSYTYFRNPKVKCKNFKKKKKEFCWEQILKFSKKKNTTFVFIRVELNEKENYNMVFFFFVLKTAKILYLFF